MTPVVTVTVPAVAIPARAESPRQTVGPTGNGPPLTRSEPLSELLPFGRLHWQAPSQAANFKLPVNR